MNALLSHDHELAAQAPAGAGWPLRVWEIILVLAAMTLLMYRPGFADGSFNHTETGLYLGNIQAIFQGKVPYRDIFLQFGPLNDYLPALFLKVFGPTIHSLRAFFFFSAILTVLLGWVLALKTLRARPFLYATALVLVYEVFNPHWAAYWGGLRHAMGLLVLLALFGFLDSPRRRPWLFVSGLLGALALLTSIEVGLFACAASALLVALHAWYHRLAWREFWGHLLALAGGWASVMLPFLAYYLAVGALKEYLRIAFYDVPFNHMAKFGQKKLIMLALGSSPASLWNWLFSANFKMFLPFGVLAAGAFSCLRAWRARALQLRHFQMLALILYGLPLFLVSFREFGGPQSQSGFTVPIVLGFTLLEGLYLQVRRAPDPGAGTRWTAPNLARTLALASALVFLLASHNLVYGNLPGLLKTKQQDYALLGRHQTGLVPLNLPGAGGVWLSPKEAAEVSGTVEYLQRYTRPGEPIIVVPEAGAYFFLANRPNLLRFSTPAMAYTAERFQNEILEQLKKHPVRVIVKRNKTSGHARHAGKPDYDLMPRFYDCINEFYRKKADIGPSSILVHRDMKLLEASPESARAATPR